MTRSRAQSGPTLSWLIGAVVAMAGWMIGLSGISDNSFLTHLATGQLIWDRHSVPTTDPYTFTVAGRAWVVQSWLASTLYGGVDRLGGTGALLILTAAVCAALAALVWTLSRPAQSLLPRLGVILLVIGVGSVYWSERPLTLGLLALAVTLACAEGRFSPRWLVPTFWLWANVHGSFPLGVVALGALALGRRLDGGDPTVERKALTAAIGGCLLASINPLGPRLLVFPIDLLAKQDILTHIVEWKAPAFTSVGDRAYLLLVLVAIASLVRRPSWRAALPLLVFLPLSLISMRNIVVASIVIVPGVSAGLAGLGSLDGHERRRPFLFAAAAVAAVAVVAGVAATRSRPLDLSGYPVAAVDYVRETGRFAGDHRVATQDFVGNYIDLVEGPSRHTFIDDRFDMLPSSLVDDYLTLLSAKPGWQSVLERYRIDTVLWETELPLAELLRESDDWVVVYTDASFIVARHR